mmetsp:Transcript_5835/g.17569  ORF Transcript_5835/g.17569 Transcript_5835/m.17569 type:complete len:214 (+) Transcript_5835:657-1298(+)
MLPRSLRSSRGTATSASSTARQAASCRRGVAAASGWASTASSAVCGSNGRLWAWARTAPRRREPTARGLTRRWCSARASCRPSASTSTSRASSRRRWVRAPRAFAAPQRRWRPFRRCAAGQMRRRRRRPSRRPSQSRRCRRPQRSPLAARPPTLRQREPVGEPRWRARSAARHRSTRRSCCRADSCDRQSNSSRTRCARARRRASWWRVTPGS